MILSMLRIIATLVLSEACDYASPSWTHSSLRSRCQYRMPVEVCRVKLLAAYVSVKETHIMILLRTTYYMLIRLFFPNALSNVS